MSYIKLTHFLLSLSLSFFFSGEEGKIWIAHILVSNSLNIPEVFMLCWNYKVPVEVANLEGGEGKHPISCRDGRARCVSWT